MFGFLNPLCRSTEYRKLYCDSCAHLRQNYGRWSTPFLSYEAVLVHAMAFDAGLIRDEDTVSPCRVVPVPKRPKATSDTHRHLGEFSSALTHLLVKTKVEDDILDDRSWRARLLNRLYHSKFDQSVQYFSDLDTRFEETMNGFLKSHRNLELSGSATSLTEYAKPTADAFGYVYGLLGVALDDPGHAQVYSEVGRRVGEAIICADCGYDWNRDMKRGFYNPVQTLEESALAIAASQAALREGDQTTKLAFGENCVTEQILLGVHDRLYRMIERDKRYEKYLVPLHACSTAGILEEKQTGIIMASNAACPTLALFAQAEGGGGAGNCFGMILFCLCCLGIITAFTKSPDKIIVIKDNGPCSV